MMIIIIKYTYIHTYACIYRVFQHLSSVFFSIAPMIFIPCPAEAGGGRCHGRRGVSVGGWLDQRPALSVSLSVPFRRRFRRFGGAEVSSGKGQPG